MTRNEKIRHAFAVRDSVRALRDLHLRMTETFEELLKQAEDGVRQVALNAKDDEEQ